MSVYSICFYSCFILFCLCIESVWSHKRVQIVPFLAALGLRTISHRHVAPSSEHYPPSLWCYGFMNTIANLLHSRFAHFSDTTSRFRFTFSHSVSHGLHSSSWLHVNNIKSCSAIGFFSLYTAACVAHFFKASLTSKEHTADRNNFIKFK